jgi:hypothetical protein
MSQKTVVQKVYTNPFSIIVSVLAVMVSWYFNKSIGWAIFHYIFGWIYMIYSLLIGRFADGGFMEIINSYF